MENKKAASLRHPWSILAASFWPGKFFLSPKFRGTDLRNEREQERGTVLRPSVMESISCLECDKSFPDRRRLLEHQRRVHTDESLRTCPHCHTTLKNRGSLPKHVRGCKKAPTNEIECVMTPCIIPPSPTNPNRKTASKKQNIDSVELYLKALRTYLTRGGFINTFQTRRDSLWENTIMGYLSSIRKYLEVIAVSIRTKKRKADSEENEECSLAQLLLTSIKVSVMYPFLSDSEKQLQVQTVVNYAAALQWHLIYLRFLLHPDLAAQSEEEKEVCQAIRSTIKQENDVRGKEMKEAMKKIKTMMQKTAPEAEKQTILRNGKEALVQQGRWVEMKFVIGIQEAVDAEGWVRLESLTRRLALMQEAKATQFDAPMAEQYLWLRDWIIFSFFVDMPPMRPQNAVLEILEEVQFPGSRRANGILFFKDMIRIQLISFKNSRYTGERIVRVPQTLEKKLRAYVQHIRPAFENVLRGKVNDEKDDEEEEEEEEEHEVNEEKESEEDFGGQQIIGEAKQWCKQSAFLFLQWKNQPIKRPGKYWIEFIYRMCGKRISIGIWRKIVETHSSKVNTREEQEKVSEALLHQHRTGQRYYRCEDVDEVSDAMMETWNNQVQKVTESPPSQPVLPSPSSPIPVLASNSPQWNLTPTQRTYIPKPGDWQCKNCGNVNFARRQECRRCAIRKIE